jgi:hypothetical protein
LNLFTASTPRASERDATDARENNHTSHAYTQTDRSRRTFPLASPRANARSIVAEAIHQSDRAPGAA